MIKDKTLGGVYKMRFQKAIKRMIALGTGAIMLSSLASAAADLANYPAPFVKDGKFSGVLIVGDKAAAEDVIAVTDVALGLQSAAVKKVSTTTGGEVTPEGDAWKVGTSTKRLELSEDLAAGGASSRETLRNITTFIDKSNLKALASGSITNNKVTSPYNQYLYMLGPGVETSMDSGYVQYTENSDDDVTGDYLFFKSGKEMFRYLIEFTTSLESDVDDSTGSSSATGLFLTDYQDVDLNLFGKKYTIVTAKRTTTNGKSAVLTLMGGSNKDTLLEKQTKTYTIGGKTYEVTLNFVDADEAQFIINGQSSRKLKDGDTDKLADGTTVGVTDILYQDYAGGIHSSTFFLGANKIELKDTNVITSTGEGDTALKVDDNSIDDAVVTIEATDDNSTFKITRIHVNMSADDDYFVPAGGKLSAAIKAAGGSSAEPQVLFTENWDVEYKGLSKEPTEKVKIRTSGSSQYNLEFVDGGGNKVDVPIAKAPSGASVIFGEQSKAFINVENTSIAKDDYLVLSDSTAGRKRGERPTYVLQYKGADKITNDNPTLKFRNLGSGETIEQTYASASTLDLGVPGGGSGGKLATLKVGGSDFGVWNASSIAANDFRIVIDQDASGSVIRATEGTDAFTNATPIAITTKNGMEINVTNVSDAYNDQTDIVRVTFRIPDESRDGTARDTVESLKATPVRVDLYASSAKVSMTINTTNITNGNRLNFRTPDGKTNIGYVYDSYGSFYTQETPTNDPATLTIEVPAKQSTPLVYISSKGTTFSETAVSSGDAVTLQRIEVGAAKLASEVPDVKAQNTLLVGGPCANAAAATVMGNPADCTAGFTPGEGIIQVWEHANGNVAMLVAGYSAVDTRNAGTVVANYKDYKAGLKGMKVVVKKVSGQLTVATPVAAAPAPAAGTTA